MRLAAVPKHKNKIIASLTESMQANCEQEGVHSIFWYDYESLLCVSLKWIDLLMWLIKVKNNLYQSLMIKCT